MSFLAISSGHGLKIRGASGDPVPPQLEEVNEARRVVNRVAELLNEAGVETVVFHDDVSTTQSDNLNRIVNWHNAQTRTFDASLHFNAFDGVANGTEVLYVSEEDLAEDLALAIADAGDFINRGAKYRSDLKFLNSTHEPAVLLEICFCDNTGDSQNYQNNFEAICESIAEVFEERADIKPPITPPPEGALLHVVGPCSQFGGPDDDGVSPDEGLAFLYEVEDAPHLFLPEQPAGTSGLARRLDPRTFYVACRWDYSATPKDMLRDHMHKVLVRAHGKEFLTYPADWGPHSDTGRVADLSPGLMAALDLATDDEVEVIYPAP